MKFKCGGFINCYRSNKIQLDCEKSLNDCANNKTRISISGFWKRNYVNKKIVVNSGQFLEICGKMFRSILLMLVHPSLETYL